MGLNWYSADDIVLAIGGGKVGIAQSLPQQALDVTGNIIATGYISGINDKEANEPSGFVNRTDSNISFVDGTRTFTITPVVTSFVYYCDSIRYEITTTKSIIIDDVNGL